MRPHVVPPAVEGEAAGWADGGAVLAICRSAGRCPRLVDEAQDVAHHR